MVGHVAALGSAIAWAIGSVLFRKIGDRVPPPGMNLAKCLVSLVLLGFSLGITGWEPLSDRVSFLLGISGLLGITLGDTFFFRALVALGPRMTLLMAALGPVVTALLAMVCLHERPSALALLGMATTSVGVLAVTWTQAPVAGEERKIRTSGILYSLLSILAMSASIIFAKAAIPETPVLQGTFLRMAWAAGGLFLWGGGTGQLRAWARPFSDPSVLRLTVLGTFVVVFGGFALFLAALKQIDASVATVLESTTPLWILPISFLYLNEQVRRAEIVGALLAVLGIALIILS